MGLLWPETRGLKVLRIQIVVQCMMCQKVSELVKFKILITLYRGPVSKIWRHGLRTVQILRFLNSTGMIFFAISIYNGTLSVDGLIYFRPRVSVLYIFHYCQFGHYWIIIHCVYGRYGVWSSLADPGIYFGGPNQDPQSKVEGEARIEGAKRPSIEGEARVEGAKRPRIEGEAQTKGEAREKAGEGSGEGARWAPPQKIFEKSNLKPFILVYIWSNYLKWLTKWFNCPHSWKIISNYLMWRNY